MLDKMLNKMIGWIPEGYEEIGAIVSGLVLALGTAILALALWTVLR